VHCSEQPPPFAALAAPYIYGGPLADAIALAKFHRREDVAAALGKLLAAAPQVRQFASQATCIVPVPLGARRRRSRGYNQSAILARALAASSCVPVVYGLRRVRETAPQSDLPLDARRANVDACFRAGRTFCGLCLLVDDVVTSGETVRQAALALLGRGAASVVVVALARTPLES
jgi:ComF family protein